MKPILNEKKRVTCLTLSKQLRKAGYPQKGLWWWVKCSDNSIGLTNTYQANYKIKLVAPTVGEGLNRLPDRVTFKKTPRGEMSYYLTIQKVGSIWYMYYRYNYGLRDYSDLCSEDGNKLVNVVHLMWLYLKKEGKL